eukprot:TRINITY_DN1990_c0_g2_i1.p1 TRINITY_DN1990_c0_g2~~TRINITY_DN1990_c0_g2_i1.p1  ORF type:complete len:384 (-),score=49.41 TRINITY_DN1990_c0_g2_i1:684-1835(-)
MGTSPERLPGNRPDFRAPPPSPIATANGRRSAVANDEVLTEFLEHSLRIPDLVLPDSIFPSEISAGNPPEIDFQSLISPGSGSVLEVLESVAGIGCFQLVNCGISGEMIGSARAAGGGIFEISAEKKAEMLRSAERRYGFEEAMAEISEEFWWCGGDEERDGLNRVLEGIWPHGHSNFSDKIESLCMTLEQIASKLLQILLENMPPGSCKEMVSSEEEEEEEGGGAAVAPVLCIYKHGRNIPSGKWVSFMQSDIIRMMIQRSDYSHALCLHLCDAASEFHVYSKRGWMSFCPSRDAIVVTVGDQIQECSDGLYKHVIGRPILHMEDEDSISMAFLYSPPPVVYQCQNTYSAYNNKSISLGQQIVIAMCLTLLFQFIVYIYKEI